MARRNPIIVGITGGSGSGKTRFLESLISQFSQSEICIISQDDYYRPPVEQIKDENGWINFDLPESIDHEAFAAAIFELRNGGTVEIEEYLFNNDRPPAKKVFHPAPIIVVEGIFVLYHQDIERLLDLKIFIEAHTYLMLKRRIERDLKERGYSLEEILYMFDNHVMPAYQEIIEPLKYNADIVVPNNKGFDQGLAVVAAYLRKQIS